MLVEVCMRATGTGKEGTITHGVCVSAAYFDSILSGREADPKIEALSRNSKNVLQSYSNKSICLPKQVTKTHSSLFPGFLFKGRPSNTACVREREGVK